MSDWIHRKRRYLPAKPKPQLPARPGLGQGPIEVIQGRVLPQQNPQQQQVATAVAAGQLAAGMIGALICAVHGFKRHGDSLAWALVWGGAGFWCPIVAVPMALSQGYGKKLKKG